MCFEWAQKHIIYCLRPQVGEIKHKLNKVKNDEKEIIA